MSGSQKDGVTTVTYRRPLAATEALRDKAVLTSRAQSVIAAFGPLNSRLEANAHSFMDTTRTDVQIDFGAQVLLSLGYFWMFWYTGDRNLFLYI